MSTNGNDLDVLDPPVKQLAYRGQMVPVGALTVGQIPKLVRECRPVIEALMASDRLDDIVGLTLDLVEQHGEAVFRAIALCIDRPVELVAKGNLVEFGELAAAVIEVNRDFFVQTLAPRLAALRAGRVNGSAPGDGQTLPSPSSSAGTH